jgi:hypothetical protein
MLSIHEGKAWWEIGKEAKTEAIIAQALLSPLEQQRSALSLSRSLAGVPHHSLLSFFSPFPFPGQKLPGIKRL